MRTKKFSAEQCEYFSKVFPVMSNTEVAQLLNVSVTTVKNYADIMELKKDPAYLSSVSFNSQMTGRYLPSGIPKVALMKLHSTRL